VPVPIAVSEFAIQTNLGDLAPSPGPGKYLRIIMANSPVPADNLGGVATDDLAAYTQIDSFGYAGVGNYAVYQEPVERLLQRAMSDISTEKHSQLDDNSGNVSRFRLWDPNENFNGLTMAIPLVYPSKGTDFFNLAPLFSDFPRLHANGDSRVGLPDGFFFLCQRIDARTDQMLNAYLSAIKPVSGQGSLYGRPASQAHPGDPSRQVLTVNAK
jgi:hypothetical protein